MSETSKEDLAKLTSDFQKLITSKQTLLLSTVSTTGFPLISYAPYVQDDNGIYYIYVSELAAHTQNLLTDKQAAILFIRPESESINLFARERAVFNCIASEVARDDENYMIQLQAMQEKFGEVIGVLRSLTDFHLFALNAHRGQYIVGFGQAYSINMADGTLKHISVNQNRENT